MLKINKLNILFYNFSLHILIGLSDAERVLRNEKKNTTDEFLVKKKKPLTLPPEYDTLLRNQ